MKRFQIVVCASIFAAAPCEAQVIIDSFDEGAFSITTGTEGKASITTTADPASIVGGTRRVFMAFNFGAPPSSASLVPSEGFLQYDRQHTGTFALLYGEEASIQDFPVSMLVDLTSGGGDRFVLELSAAPGPVQLQLLVTSASTTPGQRLAASATIGGDGPGTYTWPFASFSVLDFTKVTGIQLFMSNPVGPNGIGEYRFENFEVGVAESAVPEPRSYAVLFGGGLIALAVVKRSKEAHFFS